MAESRITRGSGSIGAIRVGGGNLIKKISKGTFSLNPASIAATTRAGTAVTITGLAVGDKVLLEPPAALEDDLIYAGCRVTAANELTVYLYNPTAGAIDGAALTWDYLMFEF